MLDFSQFLAGPSAALRLADLGARVIKVERTGTGDANRQLKFNGLVVDGDSVLFHTINRNKESYAVDLKHPEDRAKARTLVSKADVLIQNFRPGVMDRLGLGYEAVKAINPRIVYGSVSGYGADSPWKDLPGQDLLAQARSGIGWIHGLGTQPPMPTPLAICDTLAGHQLVQGILACLLRRATTGSGGLVEVSLLEASLDFQFEMITTYLNDGHQPPRRCNVNGGHPYNGAPYGFYATRDGHIALAMGSIPVLAGALGCPQLERFQDPSDVFTHRDEIKRIIQAHVKDRSTEECLEALTAADYWAAPVYTWGQLVATDGFQHLNMLQEVSRPSGATLKMLRCPIRLDGEVLKSSKAAPRVGDDNAGIEQQFHL